MLKLMAGIVKEDVVMTESTIKPEVVTREEVMRRLKIGRNAFYRLVREGKIESYKDGNRIKVPASSVERYITTRINDRA